MWFAVDYVFDLCFIHSFYKYLLTQKYVGTKGTAEG